MSAVVTRKCFLKAAIYLAVLFFAGCNTSLHCQARIGKIFIDNHPVFDSTSTGWFFWGDFANFFHATTKKHIIDDELLFAENDVIDDDALEETERNLRSMNLFTTVNIYLDSSGYDTYDAIVETKDRWSLRPSIILSSGGDAEAWGAKLEELNFLGYGYRLKGELIHRSENSIGWQGTAELEQRRLFRSEISVACTLFANKYRTEENISLKQPFRTLSSKQTFGINLTNNYGSDLLFPNNNSSFELMNFHERRIGAWWGRAWKNIDRVFFTIYGELEDVARSKPEWERAYDNSGKLLLGFSSSSETFDKTTKLNGYLDEDIPEGGWGQAVLGKTFPIGSKGGQGFYYVAAQGEKSYYKDNLYVFGQVTGASCFYKSYAAYTYQEFLGIAFYRFNDKLLLAGRIRQQNVWNWSKLRQLVLDTETGLRGYALNKLIGSNRIIANIEMRFFPDLPIWIFNLSAVGFWDTGAIWNQNTKLIHTRWHNSLGFGIRIHDMKSSGSNGIYRLDLAFNFDERRFGEIIFTTDQLFSVFQRHDYRLPQIYGLEFDGE
jgi:outer membrane protein assembly factor BamA